MSFEDIQQLQSSDKFFLVRVQPSRLINDYLTVVSGTVYSMTFPYKLINVKQNGVLLTRVSSNPVAGQYSYDESTKLLTVHLSAAPSGSNIIVTDYQLYFTQSRVRTHGLDPINPSVDLVEWEPRVKSVGGFSQDISDILNGILTISSSSLTLINNEEYFQQYFTIHDSWYDKNIEVWHCLDRVENIKKVFDGKIQSASISRESLNLSIADNSVLLNSNAYMGTEKLTYNLVDFPNLHEGSVDTAVRYFAGVASRYTLLSDSSTDYAGFRVDPDSLTKATCVSTSTTIGKFTNKVWSIGRVSSAGFEQFGFTPINWAKTGDYQWFEGTTAQIAKFKIGDTFEDGDEKYHRILDIVGNRLYFTKDGDFKIEVQSNDCPTIVIKQGDNSFYLTYGKHYTATTTTLGDGNKYLEITFVDDIKGEAGLDEHLDPNSHEVLFRVRPASTDKNHSDVLKEIITKAGLVTSNTSFSTAKTELNSNACFSIPYWDESDYGTYTNYIQRLLQSTMGYILVNENFEIEYKLFKEPQYWVNVLNDNDIKEKSFNINIEYQDIITEIIAYNPHCSSKDFANSSQTLKSLKAEHLNGIKNSVKFVHSLEDITQRLQYILDLRSNRKAEHSFDSIQLDFNLKVGDDHGLVKKNVLGQRIPGGTGIKILKINKSVNSTKVSGYDLKTY